jgi:hypothetical protein
VSRAASRPVSVEGPSASAAKMSARLLIDLEPGTVTTPVTGPSGRGAGQPIGFVTLPSSFSSTSVLS